MSSQHSRYQRVVAALGFAKMYNFPLWVIFGGVMLGFSLARFQYLSDQVLEDSLATGEWYWFSQNLYNTCLKIHLGCILPCGIIGVFQFLPIIRKKALLLHRIDGYIFLLLLWVSTGAALAIARRSFGGTVETQAGVFVLSFLTLTSSSLAYYNIKRLQIEQHRAWMLRTMIYMGSIITMRILMIISAISVTVIGSYHGLLNCDELSAIVSNSTRFDIDYPTCKSSPGTLIPIRASLGGDNMEDENASVAFRLTFGTSLWVAAVVHYLAAEIYLRLTPAESERLRMVSYERQLERGWIHPGSGGLTSDRWGDAKWSPVPMEEAASERPGK
ncbi:unnamed protein product [Tuber melanosporum]|uniref:(Perigord truffle) hypothetical protein n=1 Tax=Tuber melanosporum (strain Mel28) TaxID=656061 RepID=D5GIR4_TUBMM|nr:uncharacterized protein GSTUM_00008623001 [Tuber melanosporum]CAZ84407.1 unnamed protein product [Tuber melanosporum]